MSTGLPRNVARLVSAAGGRIVGRTRLQKTASLLLLAGLDLRFPFSYHIHGPYSEDLSVAASDAAALGFLQEEKTRAHWGGWYSTYTSNSEEENPLPRFAQELARLAAEADSVELELAVTAAFLAKNDVKDPWPEVASRKSEKATPERIKRAKELYKNFTAVDGCQEKLPVI